MRALFILPAYAPAWAFGGTVSSNVNLCRALTRQGIEVVVYTTNADGKGGRLTVQLNTPIFIDRVQVWYFNCDLLVKKAFYSMELHRHLKQNIDNFDIIHVAAFWQLLQYDVYKMCRLFSKPFVISLHGSISSWGFKNNLRKTIYWYFWGCKPFRGNRYICFTCADERSKSFLNKPFLEKLPSFIIPNGLDIDIIKQRKNIREMFHIPSNKFILLYIGRIYKIKGIHFVLEALKKLNDKRFVFMIVGNKEDINYVNYLTELSKDLIKDTILWCDQVNPDEVWDYYYAADLFVLPSYHENFSMVVVEAMACGLPVVITKNVGIWREVQSDGSGVVIDQNANAIAEALEKLSNDMQTLNNMKANAKKSVESRYNLEKVGHFMKIAYEDILAGKRSPGLQWK